jgi:hypothetical protein
VADSAKRSTSAMALFGAVSNPPVLEDTVNVLSFL